MALPSETISKPPQVSEKKNKTNDLEDKMEIKRLNSKYFILFPRLSHISLSTELQFTAGHLSGEEENYILPDN